MQVYKTFFKIILKNRMQLGIYLIVFTVLTLIFTVSYTSPTSTDFLESKINIALINEDTDSVFMQGFISYLTDYANIVDLPDDPQSLQDALYFREVEYVLRIPAGFTDSFLNNQTTNLEKTIVPNSTSATFMDLRINQYLNTAQTYLNYGNVVSQYELVSSLQNDFSNSSSVTLNSHTDESDSAEKMAYYYNFMAYSLFAILILGVCAVMLVFNDSDIKKRNFASPLKTLNYNSQLVLGSLSFAVLAWLLMVALSFIINSDFMFSEKGLLLILNSFVFTMSALSISFFISNLVKSRSAMSAVANVFALGTSFISGVFVEQVYLGDTVLSIASFTPTYWYVKANNAITSASSLSGSTLTDILTWIALVLGFGIAILGVTLVLLKNRKVEAR
ncbi:MAG: linearmycin/streptolysin transport system permease protein [Eubacteriaceae bacterium]|nr:linearmycin/streptolysin transport system permease protein [Eubacteriaceae bacterium]